MGFGSVCCMLSLSFLASIPLAIGAIFAHYCDTNDAEDDEDDTDEND